MKISALLRVCIQEAQCKMAGGFPAMKAGIAEALHEDIRELAPGQHYPKVQKSGVVGKKKKKSHLYFTPPSAMTSSPGKIPPYTPKQNKIKYRTPNNPIPRPIDPTIQ
jgi:hypothetical protein